MKTVVLAFFFFMTMSWSLKASAQLPSEKPMRSVYSKKVQEQLDATKHTSTNSQLPSEAPLPAPVRRAAGKHHTLPVTAEEQQKRLPSNSKNRKPVVRSPRKL
jgi:hypothetical protein